VALGLGVVSSSPILGIELTEKIKTIFLTLDWIEE